jgi:beta-aspartyl-peptidase (threonine type)
MTHLISRAALLLLLVPVPGGAGTDPPAEAEVRALLDRQVADWNRRDLDGFLAGYWDSPDVVFQSGAERSRGFAAMRDRYRKNYQAEGKEMGTLTFSDVEIEALAPDVALARGRWALDKADGSRPNGLFTLIVRRFPGGWKIVHDHTSVGTR